MTVDNNATLPQNPALRFPHVINQFSGSLENKTGKVLKTLAEIRNNIALNQKITIATKSLIEAFQAARNTFNYTKLTRSLDCAFFSDFFEPIPNLLGYVKPINVNTVHAPALIQRLTNLYMSALSENAREDYPKTYHLFENTLKKFFACLTNEKAGNFYGFKNEQDFLVAFEAFFCQTTSKASHDFVLRSQKRFTDVQLPLIQINWGEWLTCKTFEVIGAMTVVAYLREWDLVNTAKWAASIGKIQGLNWIGKLNYSTVFNGMLFSGFTLAFCVAMRKIYASTQQVGPFAKKKAPYEAVGAFAEAAYFMKNLVADLRIKTFNPVIDALSQFAAKAVGIGVTVAIPKNDDSFDTPLENIAKPCKMQMTKAKINKFFAPVTQYAFVLALTNKVHQIATLALETLNDFMSLDNFDKLFKVVMPALNLLDMGLKEINATTTSLFTKTLATMEGYKDLLYASKIFTALPNWLYVYNSNRKCYEFVTPLFKPVITRDGAYVLDIDGRIKTKFQPFDGTVEALMAIGASSDFFKYLRKKEIYRFQSFVDVGNKIAQVQIFGKRIEEIPGLREINRSIKNLTTIIWSSMKIGQTVYKRDFYENQKVLGKTSSTFSLLKLTDWLGNWGKLVLCVKGVDGSFTSQLIAFLTGASGLTFLVRKYRLRQKIRRLDW